MIYDYDNEWYHYSFYFFVLSSIRFIASFFKTTRKTVCNSFNLTHSLVLICCFSTSNSVIVSVHGAVFLSKSKYFSPQKNFISCSVFVIPFMINFEVILCNLLIERYRRQNVYDCQMGSQVQ